MAILSIQSHTVYGHVGNSAATLPLQRLGFDVWPVPAAVLAFHNGHGKPAIRFTPAAEVRALVGSMDGIGLFAGCEAVLTGWLGQADVAAAALDAVRRVRAARPGAPWLCDPVIGEVGDGVYVPEDLATAIRDTLVPAADIVTPNQFELEWLTGRRIDSLASAIAALRAGLDLGPKIVVCTSVRREDRTPGRLETMVATRDGVWLAATPELNDLIYGAGDMFSALFLARLLRGKTPKKAMAFATAATYGVLRAGVERKRKEPMLVAMQAEFNAPSFNPQCERVA